MTNVELSLLIESSYPATAKSIAKRKMLYGVGENDADYTTQPTVNGKCTVDPAYRAWVNVLQRAYSQKYHAKKPTYLDVTVCKEWHSFRSFRPWWIANYREDWQLDKDLLAPGNREYGPDACIYIPGWLNSFTTDRGALRGEFPIGVHLDRCWGKYHSYCRNPITGKQHKLGYFTTPEAAHNSWLQYKLSLADQLKPQMDAIDQRIYNGVVEIIKAAI